MCCIRELIGLYRELIFSFLGLTIIFSRGVITRVGESVGESRRRREWMDR